MNWSDSGAHCVNVVVDVLGYPSLIVLMFVVVVVVVVVLLLLFLLMITYIVLFSALLSRLTALACGAT